MAQASLTIDLRQLLRLFARLQDRAANEEFLDDASAMLLNRVRTRFLAEKDTDGNPWPPSQAAIRRRKQGGTGTLFESGRLFHSIRVDKLSVGERMIFTDVDYAQYHQYDPSEAGTRRLPLREFIGASGEDVTLIEKLYLKRLQEAIR